MHGSLKKLFHKLNLAITHGAKDSENRMIPFGIFGLVAYLLYYLLNRYLLAPSVAYDTLLARIVIAVLCSFLILKDYWPKKLRPFLPAYWYITLIYSMPFFITFMTLKNHGATAWVMNLLSITILIMLLVDWASYTIVMLLGGLFAYLTYYITTPGPFIYVPGTVNYSDILSTFLISIIMGIIFSRNKEKIEQEKLHAMAAMGGNIGHELRTPLRAINNGVSGIRKHFPTLLSAYQYAIKHNANIPKIRIDHFEALLTVLDDIQTAIDNSNLFIDMLLVKINSSIKSKELTKCSINVCIDEAMRHYPFYSPNQEKLIDWQSDNDFEFMGSQLLIMHVLFNLFKNALFYIEDAGKGEIFIWTEIGEKENRLHFKDTAKGIPEHFLPQLFTRFFSNRLDGTGLGLAFCKMVMSGIGGDITCISKEGEYTEFILTFPRINDKLKR